MRFVYRGWNAERQYLETEKNAGGDSQNVFCSSRDFQEITAIYQLDVNNFQVFKSFSIGDKTGLSSIARHHYHCCSQ